MRVATSRAVARRGCALTTHRGGAAPAALDQVARQLRALAAAGRADHDDRILVLEGVISSL